MYLLAAALSAACGGSDGNNEASGDAPEVGTAPSASRLAAVAWSPGDSARGLALLEHFRDSLPAYSGNQLRCTSCHLDRGLNPSALPWLGSTDRYPRFRARSGTEETMTVRINDCIVRSLAGHVLPDSSQAMLDMLAYLRSIGSKERPEALPVVEEVGVASRGEAAFEATCSRCHGVDGGGTIIAPAVWGAESYSVGAGMARQKMLATYIRHNMPYDNAGSVSPQDAADIAAWVLLQPRQDYPGKELDWPNGDPPSDAAYATKAARLAGKPLPPERKLLPRRVSPGN